MAYWATDGVHHARRKHNNWSPPNPSEPEDYTPWPMMIFIALVVLYYILR